MLGKELPRLMGRELQSDTGNSSASKMANRKPALAPDTSSLPKAVRLSSAFATPPSSALDRGPPTGTDLKLGGYLLGAGPSMSLVRRDEGPAGPRWYVAVLKSSSPRTEQGPARRGTPPPFPEESPRIEYSVPARILFRLPHEADPPLALIFGGTPSRNKSAESCCTSLPLPCHVPVT